MELSFKRIWLRSVACLLTLALLCGALAGCIQRGGTTLRPTSDPSDGTVGEAPPEATLPDDIRISFCVATQEEAPYLYEVHGNHFDMAGNRFFDAQFYLVYRFPTHAEHNSTELIINLANQYEVSASADGVTYEILASTKDKHRGSERLVLDLSPYRPCEGEGYVYVRLGDADTSDGWGGNLSKDAPVRYFSGTAAISTEADRIVRKGDNIMYHYDLTPGGATEKEFIVRNSGAFCDMGGRPFRVCDATQETVYLFRGTPGQLAYVTIDLSHEYLIELSTDGHQYEEIVSFAEWGRYRDYRSIDMSSYFATGHTVYLRIRDYTPENGWGPQIRGMSYTVLTGGSARAAAMTVNDGWQVSVNGMTRDYTAGDVVNAPVGATVTFKKTVTVPADYVAFRALSFAYIEGAVAQTTVTVDGRVAERISGSANAMTVALPDGVGNEDRYDVCVCTVVGESGKTGLWRNVRLGMADMVRYPETARTLGDTTRPFSRAEAPYDQVQLNALAGNFLQSLYHAGLGINSIDTSMKIEDLYYVGDTARALIGVAYEEVYSPIVRLEYALGMYNGLLSAMVPTSDTHSFLKYDTRPKRVTQKGNALLWQNTQDVIEPFADMYLLPGDAAPDDVTLAYARTEEDRSYNGSAEASAKAGGASVHAHIRWYCGTSDRATTANLRAQSCDRFRVMLRFDDYGTTMKYVAADREIVATHSGRQPVELGVSDAYFVFDRLSWNTNGIVLATDVLPTSAHILPSEDGSGYAALVLEFDAHDRPNVTAVQLGGIDTNLEYAYYVIDHLTDDFTYGCNGYDPAYLADHSLGALAAGAYLMKKYNVDGWEQAVERADAALKSCDRAIVERRYIPSCWQSAMAGCHFMVLMGKDPEAYRTLAAKWADRIVAEQAEDGTYAWLDSRNPIATLTAYDITGNERYLEAARRFLEACEYTDKGVLYKGQLYEGPSFNGAGDLILMNRFGYDDPLGTVLMLEGNRIDDAGFFACFDINPYYLGYSLTDLMEVRYGSDRLKRILSLGQYVMYTADGGYTVSDCPNVYVDNPFGMPR